jgi:kynurenine formamidase
MTVRPHAGLLIATLCAALTLAAPARAQSDLAQAYRVIASKTFVDLTHSFGPGTPVWSGFGQAKFSAAADPKTHEPYTIAKDGFRTTYYEMVGQYGTHVDPPAHFAEAGITMDRIPLKQMILPLVVLDDTPYLAKDPDHAFSVADLKAWEGKHGRVPKGAFAALRTDMYKDWDSNPERFKRSPFPAWAFETIKYLYERRGVTATGHEAMDTDTTDKMDSETYILANLDQVPATGAIIVVTWPKVEKGLGFPARAFAILP